MASTKSISRSARRPGFSSLLTSGQASRRYSVSKNTLREWDNQGYITSYRAAGGSGWRRIDPRTIECHLGLSSSDDDQDSRAVPCCYCRVSSESQEKSQNRARQEKRMRQEVAAREGCGLESRAAGAWGVGRSWFAEACALRVRGYLGFCGCQDMNVSTISWLSGRRFSMPS